MTYDILRTYLLYEILLDDLMKYSYAKGLPAAIEYVTLSLFFNMITPFSYSIS